MDQEEDIDAVLEALPLIVEKLRAMSPLAKINSHELRGK